MLEPELDTLDGLDKAFHSLYTQRDGKFALTGVKGYTPEDREKVRKALDKERKAAETAIGALKPWKTMFGEKTPDEIQTALDSIDELKLASKGKLDESAIEERVTARLEAAKKPLQRKIEEASEKAAKAEARVKAFEQAEERAAVRAAIQKEALASGALPESYADGGGLLAVLEGKLKVEVEATTDEAGNPVRKLGRVLGADGTELPKLIQQVQSSQGYFWGTSKGGGANPRGGGGPATGGGFKGNPFDPKTLNRTEQLRLKRENRPLYDRYKSEAGA